MITNIISGSVCVLNLLHLSDHQEYRLSS